MRHRESKSQFYYPPVGDTTLQSECYLTCVGESECAPGSPYPPKSHPDEYHFDPATGRVYSDFSLIMITKGEGTFETVQGCPQRFCAGSGIFLVPGKWHTYRPSEQSGRHEVWISLNGQHLHRLQNLGILPSNAMMLHNMAVKRIATGLRRIFREAQAAEGENRISSGLAGLSLIVESLEKQASLSRNKAEAKQRKLIQTDVQQSYAFVIENSHRPVDLATIAKHSNISLRTLQRRFKEAYGMTVQEHLIQCRLKRAKALLIKSELPIKSIAYMCGFENSHRMIACFNRLEGRSPSAYRNNARSRGSQS